ncbi:hypothetical protein [Amycolatopsis sp. NPDC059021]|uniref:DUF7282 domain-containing protein n=1 Tax=Amycolatopsis sp. NPDC059021 TaxID=3346704 RepID=UPI00366CB5AD
MTKKRAAVVLTVTSTGLLAALLGGCAGGVRATPTSASPAPGATSPGAAPVTGRPAKPPAPVPFPHAELDIDDQRGDGARVLIEDTDLPVAGHVAVYDQPGNLIGSAPVPAGAHRGGTITFQPVLGPGSHSLRAVLTVDDGDGRFDPARDAPVREAGDPVDDLEDDNFLYTVG